MSKIASVYSLSLSLHMHIFFSLSFNETLVGETLISIVVRALHLSFKIQPRIAGNEVEKR
jgi:hypothetical protein